jgi:hypothetical protein
MKKMSKRLERKLISSDEAVFTKKQHVAPCSDCPWAKKALHGWIGGTTVEKWIQVAHSDEPSECHVHPNQQCAGLAIYRANVCKKPRDPEVLVLPADRKLVFSSPVEFAEHHSMEGE